MTGVNGKVVVITGAGSGIGRELALEAARRGARLALADIDEVGLADTVQQVQRRGADAYGTRVDVGDRGAVSAFADQVATHYGVVHMVFNNAGVPGDSRTILDADWDVFERVLGINLWGVIHGTKAFLPHLIASGEGHVINISSLNGIMAQSKLGPYCTAKFGVRGFTETLRAEMIEARRPVQVTVVHPGGVKTNIANAALAHSESTGREITGEDRARVRTYNEKLLRMPPERAARTIIDGVEAGRGRVIVGNDARALDLLVRAVPRLYPGLVAKYASALFK